MPDFEKILNDPEVKEAEVVRAVIDEVKSLGENTEKNYEKLNKNFEEMKKTVDKNSNDTLDIEKTVKLSEDITTRQEVLTQQMTEMKDDINKRIDSVEVAMKRLPGQTGKDFNDLEKEALEFTKNVLAVRLKADPTGVTAEKLDRIEVDVQAYKQYKENFEKYLRKSEKLLTTEQYKAMQVGIDPDGGYTVTPAMSSRIIQRIYEADPIRQLAAVETITTDALEFMVEWDEADCGWEEETVAGDETATPKMYKKRIPVHHMYARPKMTQKLIEDSGINIEAWLANKVADKMMRVEAAAFLTGDGIGKPRGMLTYDNGTNYGQIEQVASGNAAALTPDGLIDLKYSFVEYYLERGTFLMRRSTLAEIIKFKDGNGNFMWSPGLARDKESLLLGLPVRLSPTVPAIAAAALSVILADFREAYQIVDRLGITVQRDPYTVKPFIEFYTRKRVGGDVVNYEAIKIQVVSA